MGLGRLHKDAIASGSGYGPYVTCSKEAFCGVIQVVVSSDNGCWRLGLRSCNSPSVMMLAHSPPAGGAMMQTSSAARS